jgi:hypothetical protein
MSRGWHVMNRYVSLALLVAILQSSAYCATGSLVVFDDADENGFSHAAASCGSSPFANFGETTTVHSGSAAIAISKLDNNGAGWLASTSYSASTDYDGMDFWVNAGDTQTTLTSLAVSDASFTPHFLHLEDMYGAPLPVNTWIHFQVPFSSPFFAVALSTPPETVQMVCVISHETDGMTKFLFLDDVSLRGADIFKSGFDG